MRHGGLMWQRSHEIICLYISSKPAKGLWEKSGAFAYIDSPWLLARLKTRGQTSAKNTQLEEVLVPGKETHPPISEVCPLSTLSALFILPGSSLERRQGISIGWTQDLKPSWEAQGEGGSPWVGKSLPASVLPCSSPDQLPVL